MTVGIGTTQQGCLQVFLDKKKQDTHSQVNKHGSTLHSDDADWIKQCMIV